MNTPIIDDEPQSTMGLMSECVGLILDALPDFEALSEKPPALWSEDDKELASAAVHAAISLSIAFANPGVLLT